MPMMLIGKAGRRQRWTARARSVMLDRLFGSLYGPGARFYDRFTRIAFVGEWQRWQMAALPDLPLGGVVVELGSGTGALAASASASFGAWIGLDRSRQMITVARRRLRPMGPTFVRACATRLPLRAGLADAVVATFPSPYIYEQKVLDEVRRVMKPDGRLVIVLTGDLAAVGLRRHATRALAGILLGSAGGIEVSCAFPGFAGQCEWRRTEFGRAVVFVGPPDSTRDDGCSRQPVVAAGRG